MGAANAKAVFALWGHLSHVPFRALLYMAVVAKDHDPRYWGGWEALALAIGRGPAELGDPERRTSARKAVERVMAALAKAHAIERLNVAAPGRNAEYRIITGETVHSGISTDDPQDIHPPLSEGRTPPAQQGASRPKGRRTANGTPPAERANAPRSVGVTPPAERGAEERAGASRKKKDLVVVTQDDNGASPARDRAREAAPPGGLKLIPGSGRRSKAHPPDQPALWPAPVETEEEPWTPSETTTPSTSSYRVG